MASSIGAGEMGMIMISVYDKNDRSSLEAQMAVAREKSAKFISARRAYQNALKPYKSLLESEDNWPKVLLKANFCDLGGTCKEKSCSSTHNYALGVALRIIFGNKFKSTLRDDGKEFMNEPHKSKRGRRPRNNRNKRGDIRSRRARLSPASSTETSGGSSSPSSMSSVDLSPENYFGLTAEEVIRLEECGNFETARALEQNTKQTVVSVLRSVFDIPNKSPQ